MHRRRFRFFSAKGIRCCLCVMCLVWFTRGFLRVETVSGEAVTALRFNTQQHLSVKNVRMLFVHLVTYLSEKAESRDSFCPSPALTGYVSLSARNRCTPLLSSLVRIRELVNIGRPLLHATSSGLIPLLSSTRFPSTACFCLSH